MNHTKTILCLTIILLVGSWAYYGCRKSDKSFRRLTTEEKFFSISSVTPAPIRKVFNAVKKQNKERQFIEKVAHNFGYPVWDKALIVEKNAFANTRSSGIHTDSSDLVYIPFAKSGLDYVAGILIVKLGAHDSTFYMLGANHYPGYGFQLRDSVKWNAQDVFNVFALFENRLFKHTKFRILDRRIFPITGDQERNLNDIGTEYITRKPSATDSSTMGKFIVPVVTCETYDVCYDSDGGSDCCGLPGFCSQGCSCWDHAETECTWMDIEIGGGDGGPLSLPGETAGGGWENTSPCKTIPTDSMGVDCNTNAPSGWTPMIYEDEIYDPYQADTIKITNDLKDSFPCLYRLIHDSLGNVNLFSQLQLFSTFNVPQHNHYVFTVEWSWDQNTIHVMKTKDRGKKIGDDWYDTIWVNPYWAAHSSKEFLIATALHESIHAYIWWCFKEYMKGTGIGQVDSIYIMDHFPLYWQKFKNLLWDYSVAHELMAYNYTSWIADHVFPFTNPAAPMEKRRLMANCFGKNGLAETSAWGYAPGMLAIDTCNIKAVNYWAQVFTSDTSAFAQNCGIYSKVFMDSLYLKNPCQ